MEGTINFQSFIIFLVSASIAAQQIANNKCNEYMNIAGKYRISLSIVGGYLSHNNEFPHMAALGFGSINDIKWICGGTIISDNHILTAAHCTTNRDLGSVKFVLLGTENLKDNNGPMFSVDKIIKHPSYKTPSLYNDIAILQLKKRIQFSRSVLPACLNTVFNVRSRWSKVTATGWGRMLFAGTLSDNLRKVTLNVYPFSHCKVQYKNMSKRRLPNGIDKKIQLCAAGRPNKEEDTCQGDSGGPLSIKTGALYTVVGVTSFGRACGLENIPGVYTRVSAYIPWIEQQIWS